LRWLDPLEAGTQSRGFCRHSIDIRDGICWPACGAGLVSRRRITLGQHVSLVASDGFNLGAYRAEPSGPAKGGVVVIQEIFGVNHHIHAVCDRLAAEGYTAEAPALFDRQQPNFECGYSPDEIANARKFVANPDWVVMMRDTQAAIDDLKKDGPVAIIGFCMGGTIAFLAAARLEGLSLAIGYYGGQIAKNADAKPKVPTQLHFGEKDASIPMSDVELIKQKRGADCKSTPIPTRSTASIAMSAAATTKRLPRSPGGARSRSCRST
jgi:carboxymethylenebutenolidase